MFPPQIQPLRPGRGIIRRNGLDLHSPKCKNYFEDPSASGHSNCLDTILVTALNLKYDRVRIQNRLLGFVRRNSMPCQMSDITVVPFKLLLIHTSL